MKRRAFRYVIIGGGVAAGYAALEFTKKGVSPGELCIISDEPVAPYERPALSKGFLHPEAPVRLPGFHTCVGANEERLIPNWYKEHGIELIRGTRVVLADVRDKTLVTSKGEIITYKFLIIATGSRAVKLEEIGIKGSDAKNVCYLRNLADATKLVNVMQKCSGRNAIVVGGGYIGMECAASLVANKINVTMVFPGPHFMGGLFTPQIATYYEDFYKSKGVKIIKGIALSSFEFNSEGKITGANLKDGRLLPADMIVVGIGARPNTGLFTGQLTFEKGGINVNSRLQSSDPSVYAVGDVASFPVKFSGDRRRVEHVDAARRTARHAVSAIMDPKNTPEFDYLPFFYSRVFSLSWRFYGDNIGEIVHFGDFNGTKFGAFWHNNGRLVGCFLEGGEDDEYVEMAKVVRAKEAVVGKAEWLRVADMGELEKEEVNQKPPLSPVVVGGGLKKPVYLWCATSAILMAVLAYWYGSRLV